MTLRVSLRDVLFVAIATVLYACSSDKTTTDETNDGNTAPVASALTVDGTEDESIETVLPAIDDENDALTFTVITQPVNGSVVIVGDKATYKPLVNFNGTDSFTYKVNDGTIDSNTAEVIVNVASVNDAPVAQPVTVTSDEDTTVEVMLDASDVDGDSLVYSVLTQPVHGLVSDVIGNTITYTPNLDYFGVDSFTYRANDGATNSEVLTVSITVVDVVDAIGRLNDTGITQCANGESSGLSCPITDYPNQDAQSGRDVNNNDNSDGHAGFSFTKLDENGNELLANASEWSCVKDNVTGLVWEVKQNGNGIAGDGGLHDADDYYSWYSIDSDTNGGDPGSEALPWEGTVCFISCNLPITDCSGFDASNSFSYCNTKAFVDRVNSQGLCGASNWRLPNRVELLSIVSYDRREPAIDTEYFPSTNLLSSLFFHSSSYRLLSMYWTSVTSAEYANSAWVVSFYDGSTFPRLKTERHNFALPVRARLVQGGE